MEIWKGIRVLLAVGAFAVLPGLEGLSSAGDLNNDGFCDLVVGVPSEDLSGEIYAGSVNVVFGATSGLSGVGSEHWHQDAGLEDECDAFDYFGHASAIGDFNGDGFSDLAVGVWGEDVGEHTIAGAVNVMYGTASGLGTGDDQLWTQDDATYYDSSESGDRFGGALAAGDFNGDGVDDLAIGSSEEDFSGRVAVGALVVLYGTRSSGLSGGGPNFWVPGDFGGENAAEGRFGISLAVGDYNGDGYDDLAIGAHSYPAGPTPSAGAVFVAWGSGNGLIDGPGDDCWNQDRDGVADDAETGDMFGYGLVSADFNNDGFADLVVGAPGESIGLVLDAGAVHVLPGSGAGLTATGSFFFHQENFDSNSPAEQDDMFGNRLAAGDLNHDGYADLVVGTYREDWGSMEGTGMVHVLWGSSDGVTGIDALWLTESRLTPGSTLAENEYFGNAVAVGDFNGDGHNDLAIGAPNEDLWDGGDLEYQAGTVFVLPGSDGGLSLSNSVVNRCEGVAGGCEQGDQFGTRLTAVPRRARLFSDHFESGTLGKWSMSVP